MFPPHKGEENKKLLSGSCLVEVLVNCSIVRKSLFDRKLPKLILEQCCDNCISEIQFRKYSLNILQCLANRKEQMNECSTRKGLAKMHRRQASRRYYTFVARCILLQAVLDLLKSYATLYVYISQTLPL